MYGRSIMPAQGSLLSDGQPTDDSWLGLLPHSGRGEEGTSSHRLHLFYFTNKMFLDCFLLCEQSHVVAGLTQPLAVSPWCCCHPLRLKHHYSDTVSAYVSFILPAHSCQGMIQSQATYFYVLTGI